MTQKAQVYATNFALSFNKIRSLKLALICAFCVICVLFLTFETATLLANLIIH